MKPVKNFLFATLLVSAMAVSTMAGVQDTPGAVPTPTPTPSPEESRLFVPAPETDTTVNTADYLFLEVLTALLSVY